MQSGRSATQILPFMVVREREATIRAESCLGNHYFVGSFGRKSADSGAGKFEIESLRNDIQMNLNRGREVNTRIRAENTRIRRAKTFSHKAERDNQYFSASDSAIAQLGRRRRFAVVDCSKAKRN